MGFIVDRHYLTPLFNPGSIVVFAGDPDAEPPTPLAATLRRALREGGYAGRLTGSTWRPPARWPTWPSRAPTWR